MDAWTLVFAIALDLLCIAIAFKYQGQLFFFAGGLITLVGIARLIFDDALVIGHECCTSGGADVPITLGQTDLNVVALVLAAFVVVQFGMLIEIRIQKEPKF